ncbi:hypothetical protein [Vallitalea okinawensis]|uniref:hypothetical protein n=1 Tax=Vallitalea okinawensis TaxID=2078660 RepID=UPI000CFE1B7C|nr:hypothetical protein [Vallitalea okinawensis]
MMRQNFTTVRKGYSPEEVEKYISELENIIDYYKERESAITKAVINAEVTAENIVDDARVKAQDIEREALNRLNDVKEKTIQTKEKLEVFQKKYNILIQDYLVTLRSEEMVDLFDQLDEITDFLEVRDNKDTKEIEIA